MQVDVIGFMLQPHAKPHAGPARQHENNDLPQGIMSEGKRQGGTDNRHGYHRYN